MLYDSTIKDAAFAEGRPPDDIDELLRWTRERLGLSDRFPWRLISARRRFGKILFEIEEQTPAGPRRLIGKSAKSDRAETLYRTLKLLREAGFAPPARYTVPEPVALLAERGLILQEKVPGEQASIHLTQKGINARIAAFASAAWLGALHRCGLSATVSKPDKQTVLTWADDLASSHPSESGRIQKIKEAIFRELDEPVYGLVPCHGDFHPMNIFVAGRERVTGIDIDKFALREPEADVGWFLMQTAAFGFFENRSFECTEESRRAFIEHYEDEVGRALRPRRLVAYMAMAFLKNLHFELVLLKTGRTEYVEPWLMAATSAIVEDNLRLTP